jgi:cyanate lyase
VSAIDFSMDIVHQPGPKGDRVNVVLSGKFLAYKQYQSILKENGSE